MDYYSKGAVVTVFIAMFLIIGIAAAGLFAWLDWWLAISAYALMGLVVGLRAKVEVKAKADPEPVITKDIADEEPFPELDFRDYEHLDGQELNELSMADSSDYAVKYIIPMLNSFEKKQIKKYTEEYAASPHLVTMMVLYVTARTQGITFEEARELIQEVEEGLPQGLTLEDAAEGSRTLH